MERASAEFTEARVKPSGGGQSWEQKLCGTLKEATRVKPNREREWHQEAKLHEKNLDGRG